MKRCSGIFQAEEIIKNIDWNLELFIWYWNMEITLYDDNNKIREHDGVPSRSSKTSR